MANLGNRNSLRILREAAPGLYLDGGQHGESDAMALDEKRACHMSGLGFQTLRFWNNDVLLQTEAVLEKILQFAGTLTPTLSRAREKEQEHSKESTP